MIVSSYKYEKPKTLSALLELNAQEGTKLLAGGTDILLLLKEDRIDPATVADIKGVPELRGICPIEGGIFIGAAETVQDVVEHPLAQPYHALVEGAGHIGCYEIRHRATIGGNICNGSPAADTLSPFVALDAQLVIKSAAGERRALVKDIYLGANKVSLGPGELVTRIEFDRIDEYKTAFIKLGRRKALAISRLNAAAAIRMKEGVIIGARLVPGCVFAVPDRVTAAEEMLLGNAPSEELFVRCGQRVSEEMIARTGIRWSTEYKKPAIEALVERALRAACAR